MNYCSTRDEKNNVSAAFAILNGLSKEGGLFVPCNFPNLDYTTCLSLTYNELAAKLLALYLDDYTQDFLDNATKKAYVNSFENKAGETKKIANNLYSLELWHGPTCAFKDYALQLMPHLLVEAKKILNDNSITKILVATSGDTGKAALDGYCDIDGIKIAVFYPNSGTSEIQRMQMVTQNGENVSVYAVEGNFDDAQTGVKKAFINQELAEKVKCKGEKLSSANSINWGRLVPQIVYYYFAYCKLVNSGEIKQGQKIDFCIPTGNFGDILAGYYAKQMGLPINKLICASNKNNVLSDFLSTGEYNANREFFKTTSPSMDILVSSNLERLLYHVTNDSNLVSSYMKQLNDKGSFNVGTEVLSKINETFDCGFADDDMAGEQIFNEFKNNNYLSDPHTAVAFNVASKICNVEKTPCVIVSTASPYKFSADVLKALKEETCTSEFDCMFKLHEISKLDIPQSLANLQTQKVRFNRVITPSDIIKIAEEL